MLNQETIARLYKIFKNSDGVSTDTRKDLKNKLFFALSGPNFNGNLFATHALEKGAIHVVVSEKLDIPIENYTLVGDTLETLQELAKFHRTQLAIPVIAITGSNGKTTTKELTHKVLSSKFNCFATEGNLNNHIGVPLSLLNINSSHEIAVLELGANHLNEIEFLCEIAQPDFGVITSIGKDHLEGYGSLEGVKKGSAELLEYLNRVEKKFLLNPSDKVVFEIAKPFKNLHIIETANDLQFLDSIDFVKFNFQSKNYSTCLAGDFNHGNILTAFSIGSHFGVSKDDCVQAIINYLPKNNRSQIINTGKNVVFLDAYNANPTSMELAIKSFAKMGNVQKLAFLGDMAELGEFSEAEHQNIANMDELNIFEWVLFCGAEFYSRENLFNQKHNYKFFQNKQELQLFLEESKFEGKYILIKGSRSMRMEELLSFV
ncbi:MAG: UDP-N-acetylmuramoyl-tripeptide--D-alanyl-D-alanine ligase [Cytophagales bacterium]